MRKPWEWSFLLLCLGLQTRLTTISSSFRKNLQQDRRIKIVLFNSYENTMKAKPLISGNKCCRTTRTRPTFSEELWLPVIRQPSTTTFITLRLFWNWAVVRYNSQAFLGCIRLNMNLQIERIIRRAQPEELTPSHSDQIGSTKRISQVLI